MRTSTANSAYGDTTRLSPANQLEFAKNLLSKVIKREPSAVQGTLEHWVGCLQMKDGNRVN